MIPKIQVPSRVTYRPEDGGNNFPRNICACSYLKYYVYLGRQSETPFDKVYNHTPEQDVSLFYLLSLPIQFIHFPSSSPLPRHRKNLLSRMS